MKPSVFISSTYSDLKNVREELSNFIESKGYVSVLNEHGDIGYVSGTPLDESCYDAMGNCHMAILVVGGRYGSPATGEDSNDKFSEYLSITRKEFRKAKDSNIPVFVFIEQEVYNEYGFFQQNKSNIENGMNINFKAVENINVFRFIDELFTLKMPIFSFNKVEEIKEILEKQWADMLRKYLTALVTKSPDDTADELSIEGEWVSIFVEDNKILNENITIKQNGRNINAIFKLGNRKYEFTGKFKNRILIGEYVSKNSRKDERGNMMLKLIGDSIFSGYITFVYNNEQVNTSPYVWTLKSKHDLTHGTYGFCEDCVKINRKCCCANEDVDMPILMPFEVENISKKEKISQQTFCEQGSQNLYKMKRQRIDDQLEGCYFYDGHKCTIYDNRPIDCRLFPFDVAFIDGKYQLIYYTSICPSCSEFDGKIEEYSHIVKPLLTLLNPYLSESTFAQYNEKLRLHKYNIVGPLNKIF